MERLPKLCCGCGIRLQTQDKDRPGYFVVPKRVVEAFESGVLDGTAPAVDDSEEDVLDADLSNDDGVLVEATAPAKDEFDPEYNDALDALDAALDDWLEEHDEDDGLPGRRRQRGPRPEPEQEPVDPVKKLLQITCERCHKLTHEGTVKSVAAERALPEFDLGRTVGTKIARRTSRRAVVCVVVDVADFDGSLPRSALRALLPSGWSPTNPVGLPFKIILAVNKLDTIPRTASHGRIEQFVRRRVKQAGLPTPLRVHLVSSAKGIGLDKLLRDLVEEVGVLGDLWVIGAQNAGKSSLINALKQRSGTLNSTGSLTTAALPGTTLDMIPVAGIPLMAKSRCYDTPGIPHPYQLTSRLGGDDVKLLLARQKALKPRTYRVGAGNTLFIGGMCRIDLDHHPGNTVYMTVWASDMIPLHLGKTDSAESRYLRFVGRLLKPPSGSPEDIEALGPLVPKQMSIEGDDWSASTADVCIAGLGWVAFGVAGQLDLTVWTHQGVAVTSRQALLPDYADNFERPGWSENSKALFKTVDYGADDVERASPPRNSGAAKGAQAGRGQRRDGAQSGRRREGGRGPTRALREAGT